MLQVDDAGIILFTDNTTVQCIITTHTFIYIHAYICVYIRTLFLLVFFFSTTYNVQGMFHGAGCLRCDSTGLNNLERRGKKVVSFRSFQIN